MNPINRIKFLLLGLSAMLSAVAEVPAGYYSSCEGKTGQALLKALNERISQHTNVGYDGLWNVYKQSDVRADGTLWDIYTTKRWSADFPRCGNYSAVGDCVNREHSLPKSWWGGGKADQYSDAFHLYPTDGKVNGQRSNYPYGECANGTRLSASGGIQALGRLGASTFNGYSGTVFEPDDEYKGDLARSYFYMAACYNGIISGWTSGNGAQVFAGNSYPVFTTWSRDLLLKWARQDAVSDKERDRNDAIYSFQNNRNPFIDYPELIEYVWGDKVGEAWYPGGSVDPAFESPVQNSMINLGLAACGLERSVAVRVKGRNLKESVTIQASGDFSVSPTSLTAAQVNAGADVTVSVKASSAGDAEGELTMRSGSLMRTVDLYCEITNGLPAYITNVTDTGFTLRWVNMHSSDPSAVYYIEVSQGSQMVEGYPRKVSAADETADIEGLEPDTEYCVTFSGVSGGMDIPILFVTTPAPIPYIQVLFDGELNFDALPGEASEVAELLLEIENVEADIDVIVKHPFEVSTDKSSWADEVTLRPGEDRFYLRLGATAAGMYETAITVRAGDYVNDDASATATVAGRVDFLEDWEAVEDPSVAVKTYSSTTFRASACSWNVNNGGFGTGSQDKAFNGTVALRMGTDATSSIAMAEDKAGGIGVVTFDAAKWPNDSEPAAVINVDYSSDGGMTWETVGEVTVAETVSTTFAVTVNRPGNGRIRLAQTSGKRWFVDNIGITDYTSLGAVSELDYHSWDAYCRDGRMVIECRDAMRRISIYGLDGVTRFSGVIAQPAMMLPLPAGLYIVTDGDFARRVLVR